MPSPGAGALTVLVANPGADVYGSDLQLLESVSAMTRLGWRVVVVVPQDGPLVPLLTQRGAHILTLAFPVVRRGNRSARGLLQLAASIPGGILRLRAAIKNVSPDVIYVNTVTIPVWSLAARLTGTPSILHVHEAENLDSRLVLTALYGPLLLSKSLIVNSRAAGDAMYAVVKRLRHRTHLVYNGLPGPPSQPSPSPHQSGPFRLAIVCRLSPRKAPDVALEALALLRAAGRDVHLEVAGSTFPGYEWYAEELRARADLPDLAGSVTFSGYQSPVWPALERCHAVVAPSLREPFGNAVVEAQLALRPVVASAALGHLETVSDRETGLLVTPGDAHALADAVALLMDDPELAARVANQGRQEALRAFTVDRYNDEVTELVSSLANRRASAVGFRAKRGQT